MIVLVKASHESGMTMSCKCGCGRVRYKGKKRYDKEKLYADIVIGDKTRVTIMLEIGGYNVSKNVAVTTDMKYGCTSVKY